MKKIIAFIIVLGIMLISVSAFSEMKEEEDYLEIVLDPVYVVLDNQDLKLGITSISKEKIGNDDYRYVVHFSVENRRFDYSINVRGAFGNLYIGSHVVEFAVGGGRVNPRKDGDNVEIVALVYGNKKASSTRGSDYITKIEDLFLCNGLLSIEFYEEKNGKYYVKSTCDAPFSLEGYQFSGDGKGYTFEESLQGEWKVDYNSVETIYSFNDGNFGCRNSVGDSVTGTYIIDYGVKAVFAYYENNGKSWKMTIPFNVEEEGIALYGTKSGLFERVNGD